jgi:hypothetical protein
LSSSYTKQQHISRQITRAYMRLQPTKNYDQKLTMSSPSESEPEASSISATELVGLFFCGVGGFFFFFFSADFLSGLSCIGLSTFIGLLKWISPSESSSDEPSNGLI